MTMVPPYILLMAQSAPHFLVIRQTPTASPGHQEEAGSRQYQVFGMVDPPGSQVADPPNHLGFASNSLQQSSSRLPAAFLLSRHLPCPPCPPARQRAAHQKCAQAHVVCPIPNPCQLRRAFCLPPSNILSQTKTPCFPISGAPCQRPNMVGCNI